VGGAVVAFWEDQGDAPAAVGGMARCRHVSEEVGDRVGARGGGVLAGGLGGLVRRLNLVVSILSAGEDGEGCDEGGYGGAAKSSEDGVNLGASDARILAVGSILLSPSPHGAPFHDDRYI
jgi:hypothetical protein